MVILILAFPVLVDLLGRKPLGRLYKYLLGIAVLLLLALDGAALHDIVGRREPTYLGEYTVLAASVAVFVYLAWRWSAKSHSSVNSD